MRVIIGDDSEVLRTRLIEILTEIEGIEVVGYAGDSIKVVEEVAHLNPDVVILDIRMPGENGISALESIKKREKAPLVIMFTNFPYLQYRKRCLDAGADFFFYKSTEFEKLITLLKKLVKQMHKKK